MEPMLGLKAQALEMKGNAKEKGSKVAGKATTITKPTAKSGNKKKAESKKVDVATELFGEYEDDDDTMQEKPMKKPSAADDEVADKYTKYPSALREWKKKKREFERHESIGFPPHIKEEIENLNKLKGGKRAAMNKIVNEAVQIQSNGKYRLVIKSPLFEQWRTKYDDKYGKDQTIGETVTYAAQLAGRMGANKTGSYQLVKKNKKRITLFILIWGLI